MPPPIIHAGSLLLIVLTGCMAPSAPDRVVLPKPVIPVETPPLTNMPPQANPVPQPVMAALAIENAEAIAHLGSYPGPAFEYELRFRLRETQGVSGATIQNIFVGDAAGGGDNTRPSCWPFEALRVAPSGTLDTFLDWDWRSYCRLSSGANVERTALHVVVRFTDDDGRDGQMLAIINTSGAS